jgi:hypothetical protein
MAMPVILKAIVSSCRVAKYNHMPVSLSIHRNTCGLARKDMCSSAQRYVPLCRYAFKFTTHIFLFLIVVQNSAHITPYSL